MSVYVVWDRFDKNTAHQQTGQIVDILTNQLCKPREVTSSSHFNHLCVAAVYLPLKSAVLYREKYTDKIPLLVGANYRKKC